MIYNLSRDEKELIADNARDYMEAGHEPQEMCHLIWRHTPWGSEVSDISTPITDLRGMSEKYFSLEELSNLDTEV
jgi:hypothetical protein